MSDDVADHVFLPFHDVHHRARDGLLALEGGHARPFAEHLVSLIDVRHFRGLHDLVATFVVDDDDVFLGHDFVFIEDLFGASQAARGIDILDVDFSLGRVLVFLQEILHVLADGVAGIEENGQADFAFDRLEEALRFIRERVFFVTRKVPAFVVLEAQIVDHDREEKKERDLHEHVHTNAQAVNLFRGGRFFGRHRQSLHFRVWKAKCVRTSITMVMLT